MTVAVPHHMMKPIMDLVQAETGLAVASQAPKIVSKEMQPPDMTGMTTDERADKGVELKNAVPAMLKAAFAARRAKLSNETLDLNDFKPSDIAKYCEGYPHTWSEDRLIEEAEKAGGWGMEDPISNLLGDGGNAYDITVDNDDSYAKVGFAKSEFGGCNPPVPEATVKAFVAVIMISVAEVNAVVFPNFGYLIRWLKAEDVIIQLDKADAKKEERAKLLLGGKDGGYGAVKGVESAEGAGVLIAEGGGGTMVVWKGIVDSVMGDHTQDHPTNKDKRVINFMAATGTHPDTGERMPKDYVLMVRTSAEFLNRVISIAEIIIRDHFKPLRDRVFPPADMGGIAGGTKYIVDGIMFKFSFPSEDSPYLGSYELAQKATGHDIRGAISIFHAIEDVREERSDIKGAFNLNVSLLSVLDHLGFRVEVMTLLDLGKGSLKVGSGDACRTVPHGNLDETERQ